MKIGLDGGLFRRGWIAWSGIIVLGLVGFKGATAWNSRMTPEKVAAGKILFTHEWTQNDPLSNGGDGLGPVFNATSCAACHSQGGLGGSSGNEFNVTAFEVQPHQQRTHLITDVIHSDAVSDYWKESKENVERLFPTIRSQVSRTFDPIDYGSDCGSPPPPTTCVVTVVENPVHYHHLNSPALFGAGLIDQISSMSISLHGTKRAASKISKEFNGDFSGTGIGMTRIAEGGAIGKFGWKGQFSTLEDFVASACAMEIGLTNPLKDQSKPLQHKPDPHAKMDMTRRQLHELVCYVRSLPRPVQVIPTDKEERQRVYHGATLFKQIGCADCHAKNMGGIEDIYSDFHLYNLEPLDGFGAAYGDTESAQLDFNRDHPEPDQWQTPPLWGVADSAPYFHDGGSPTLLSAIKRHRGQGDSARRAFEDLSKSEQLCVIDFLNSLKAPQQPADKLESTPPSE